MQPYLVPDETFRPAGHPSILILVTLPDYGRHPWLTRLVLVHVTAGPTRKSIAGSVDPLTRPRRLQPCT